MLLKRGFVRKTFLFSALLILLVVVLSFTALYFTMPGYYLYQKEKALQSSLDSLTGSLRSAATEEEYALLIADFSQQNNVSILSFAEGERLLPGLSTPFVSMQGGENAFYSTERIVGDGENVQTYTVIIDRLEREENAGSRLMLKTAFSSENTITLQSLVGTDIVDRLTVSGTLQPIDEAKGVILSLIPYVLVIAIILGLVVAGVYARQITKPILQISNAALRMQEMEPDVRSSVRTRDELGQLSANLDALYENLWEHIKHLQEEMDKVKRLERAKTEMMQSASHELKTPIAALGGMIEGMIDNVGKYKNKEKYLAECKGQVDKLSHLVAEILGASKADTDEAELSPSETPVDQLVEQAVSENSCLILENNLALEKKLPPTTITTDPVLLYRVISNLISNAARYTPPGGRITIAIDQADGLRRLSVENDCDPIPEEELPKLFEPFYTRSFSRDRLKSGTGLGLYIVRRHLERLGIPYKAANTERGLRISLFF